MKNDPSDIMTIEEVADFLRMPVSSIYKLAQAGKIPGTKIGRRWRFHRPILETWFEGQILTGASLDEKRTGAAKADFS